MSISSQLPGKVGTTVEKRPKATKTPAPVATDRALSLPTGKGKSLPLTYWDLWFALVAARDSGGDLLRLARQLVGDTSSLYYSRDSAERKQSHLLELDRRLASAGVRSIRSAQQPVTWCEPKKKRADKFVLKDSLRERDWSAAMRDTPRERRRHSALRGAGRFFHFRRALSLRRSGPSSKGRASIRRALPLGSPASWSGSWSEPINS